MSLKYSSISYTNQVLVPALSTHFSVCFLVIYTLKSGSDYFLRSNGGERFSLITAVKPQINPVLSIANRFQLVYRYIFLKQVTLKRKLLLLRINVGLQGGCGKCWGIRYCS